MAVVAADEAKTMLSQTPYQLDAEQTLKASRALITHMRNETQRLKATTTKRSLLAEDESSDEEGGTSSDTPIWLNLTTKQHLADRNRLKPCRIPLPHSLNTNPDLRICLITADPQRAVKNVVADPTFPKSLSSRINRIIGVSKLKARYKTFESRRQLLSESDIFLADDRIISRLPGVLGKVFYKGTLKRPIPINIPNAQRKIRKAKKAAGIEKASQEDDIGPLAAPPIVAKEIDRALDSTPVSLKPGTSVAVRVGLGSFAAEELAENIEVLTTRLTEKHVVKGWRNVKSIHIKSPTSTAIPIWTSDQLWIDQQDVDATPSLEAGVQGSDLKRKRSQRTKRGPQIGQRKKARLDSDQEDSQDDNNEVEEKRKGKLASQKAQVFGSTSVEV